MPNVSDSDATTDEFATGRLVVGDDQPTDGQPRAAVVSPLPKVIEVPEPGG